MANELALVSPFPKYSDFGAGTKIRLVKGTNVAHCTNGVPVGSDWAQAHRPAGLAQKAPSSLD